VIPKLISFGVCVIIVIGLYYRKRRRVHIPLMASAFCIDLGLLLYIELTRQAIRTVTHQPHPFVAVHSLISILVAIAYVVQIASGIALAKTGRWRCVHRFTAPIFVVLRLSNFITSLWVDAFVSH
jgi:hypothetical protein